MIIHPSFPIDMVKYLKEKFNLDTFVETGTYLGGTAYQCSSLFSSVITLEASMQLYEAVCQRYAHVPNIRFIQGSSATGLFPVVQALPSAAFFWLDAHWSGGPTYGEQDQCPLIAEIEAINTSPFDNFILIDDARLFMIPPPPPHNPDQWPGVADIVGLLSQKKRYVVIYQDRILAVPWSARDAVIQFLRTKGQESFLNVDGLKYTAQRPVASAVSPDQMQKAAAIFQYILNAEDINRAIEETSANFSPALLEVIRQNILEAKQSGGIELVEGLKTLAEIVSERIGSNVLPASNVISDVPTSTDAVQSQKMVTSNSRCTAIVFSKDRPMQLDATLHSLFAHEKSGNLDVEVLYTVSDETFYGPLYETLKNKYSQVHFNREQDFYKDVIKLAAQASYILFLVDDALFVRDFNLAAIMQELEERAAVLGCSLRLGKNTHYFYMMNREQSLPEIRHVNGALCVYDWTHADGDFAYPLEVSSSVYRASEVTVLLDHISFNTPNSLEARMASMAQAYAARFPYLMCFETSVAFCAPINKVQTEAYLNRSGQNVDYSAKHLADLFHEGYRIHAEVYAGLISNGVHQEVSLKLIKEEEKPPEVSVVIPCYNYGHYLKDCVTSLASQTYSDFEVLIVNDGSTDDSAEVAQELIRDFPQLKMRLINQENSGQPAITRNNGIQLAQGRYILPLDADDYLDRRMLEASVEVLKQHEDIAIVSTDAIYFDGQNTKRVNALDFDPQLLPHQNHLSYCSLYRYAVWESVGGYRTNVRGFEDWDFWVAAAERGYRVQHLPRALFYYRVKPDGVFSQARGKEDELHAHMILNNPASYRPDEREWAKKTLSGEKSASKQPDVLVSVIMPTHNRREELLKAVESVLKQTYGHFELIIINDAGEDVADILPVDVRIRYMRLAQNRGAGGARNEGLKQAKGKYIAFLDDDDCYYPEHLNTLVRELEKDSRVAAVYSDAVQLDWIVEGKQNRQGSRSVVYSHDFSLDQLLLLNYIPNLCLMMRTEVMQKAGGFDESLSALEDWEWLIRCALLGDYKHIRTVTAEYQVRLGGKSRNMLQPDVMLKLYVTIYSRYALYASRQVMDGQAQMLKKLAGMPVDMNGYDPQHSRARLILKRIIESEDIGAQVQRYRHELDRDLIEVIRLERNNAMNGGDTELADGLLDLENYIMEIMNQPVK